MDGDVGEIGETGETEMQILNQNIKKLLLAVVFFACLYLFLSAVQEEGGSLVENGKRLQSSEKTSQKNLPEKNVLIKDGADHSELRRKITQRKSGPNLVSDAGKAIDDQAIDFRNDPKPLEGVSAKKFILDVKNLFIDDLPSAIDREALQDDVIKLNEKYQRGVSTLVRHLQDIPSPEGPIFTRMAAVDYLNYRMAWDSRTRAKVQAFVEMKIDSSLVPEQMGAMVGDQIELMRVLSEHDFESALASVAKIDQSWRKFKIAQSVVSGRINHFVKLGLSDLEIDAEYNRTVDQIEDVFSGFRQDLNKALEKSKLKAKGGI